MLRGAYVFNGFLEQPEKWNVGVDRSIIRKQDVIHGKRKRTGLIWQKMRSNGGFFKTW
jgi:hypothetical protein